MKKRHRQKKPIKRALRRPFEWLGILLGMLILSNLSHRMLFGLCDFLSAAMFRFDRAGREVSLFNLRVIEGVYPPDRDYATPHSTPPTRRETLILKRSYRNMARTIGHLFWTSRKAGPRASSVAALSEDCRRILAENLPIVTVSGHLGCWEVLSQLVHLEGHKMMSVAKDIGTPAMTRLLMRSRKSIGQEIVHADGAFRSLMQGIRDGYDLGLLVDQVVKSKEGGVWVRFFGRPMPVSAAPAFFAAKAKVPVLIAWSRPLKDGSYRCDLLDLVPAAEARDVWRCTQRCLADLERIIRRHPSCWVLNYRYFRKTPTDDELQQLRSREAKLQEDA